MRSLSFPCMFCWQTNIHWLASFLLSSIMGSSETTRQTIENELKMLVEKLSKLLSDTEEKLAMSDPYYRSRGHFLVLSRPHPKCFSVYCLARRGKKKRKTDQRNVIITGECCEKEEIYLTSEHCLIVGKCLISRRSLPFHSLFSFNRNWFRDVFHSCLNTRTPSLPIQLTDVIRSI